MLIPYWKVEEQPNIMPKRGDDKKCSCCCEECTTVELCVSKDTEPPDSATISGKGTRVLEPVRRVRFTRAALRQETSEKMHFSLGKIKVKILHQRNHHAMKFEDRSPGETVETRAMCPRRCVGTCQENL